MRMALLRSADMHHQNSVNHPENMEDLRNRCHDHPLGKGIPCMDTGEITVAGLDQFPHTREAVTGPQGKCIMSILSLSGTCKHVHTCTH